ncbi:MAG: alanine--tRNA ligase, partial [Bacteroidales bacterium]|nr:alanine--tRNA ligase [Bacteroidales bacterium]
QLIAKEHGWKVDMQGFTKGLESQKNRSREAAVVNTDDWVIIKSGINESEFIGYESLSADVEIVKYRKVKSQKNEFFQIVLNKTPFYAESGGQVGDRGYLQNGEEKIYIEDTQKENELYIHISKKLPSDVNATFKAVVNPEKRTLTANNHSATHLMHKALKIVLGNHVEQKGSLVDENHLRFDFSHFSKLTNEEIVKIETLVNDKIRENIPLTELRNIPIEKAKKMGATAIFGEKYGDFVSVIIFDKDYSVELCGGTHVKATGQIGIFKIISETAIAAGIRRVEAITAGKAQDFYNSQIAIINDLKGLLKNQKDVIKAVNSLLQQNNELQKQIDELNNEKVNNIKDDLINKIEISNGINFIAEKVNLDAATIRNLAFGLKNAVNDMFLVLGSEKDGKANLTVMISENLIKEKGLHAGNIIREIAKEINGGGGGQPHFATAGGKNPQGILNAFKKAKEML